MVKSMISLQQFKKMMEYDVVTEDACIEVEFYIDGDAVYDSCWLGKTPDPEKKDRAAYWYGLVKDGSQAYDYYTAEDLIKAPVFRGESLEELWDKVTIKSIDGCSVDYRLPFYLGLKQGPRFGPAT